MFNLKKVIASVAAFALSLSCFTAFAADFSDVEATATYKAAIDELVALEIVNGYEDGTFKPDNEITRAEVTKMVVAAMGPSYTAAAESSVGGSGFADVDPVGHWASGFIATGVAQKFINGMGDGTFAPDANVTYAQIVKMLVAALGYGVQAERDGGYPNGYLQMGNSVGITAGVKGVSADTAVTRGQVAQLISNAIDTPLVLVTSWQTNYVTGEPVAVTSPMDGTNGKAYKTLLTENHDSYVVKGRVIATKSTGGATLKPGEVLFRVEYTDNYQGAKIAIGRKIEDYENVNPEEITAAAGETDAESQLFTYAEAIVKVDEQGDEEILAIVPYGKNEIVTLAANNFDTESTVAELQFDRSETSSKNDKYKLADDVLVFVNGVEVAYAGETDTVKGAVLADYIMDNTVGQVTLIDSPEDAGKAKDGKFDVIMITQPKWAVIEETAVQGDNLKFYFEDSQEGFATLTIDTTDEDLVYSFTKNGEEAAFEDLKADDVVLVTYDVTGALKDSEFFEFTISDTVVEGTIEGRRVEKKYGQDVYVYTINGEEYKGVNNTTPLEVAAEYALHLDAAGRIIFDKEVSSSKNYAVIDRVAYSQTEEVYTARLIKPDGTREVVTLKTKGVLKSDKDSDAIDLYEKIYKNSMTVSQIKNNADNDLKNVENRMVTYKINTAGELNSVVFLDTDTTAYTTAKEYDEYSNEVGTIRMNDATAIIDFSAFDAAKGESINVASSYTSTKIKAGSLATFVDGEDYKVIAADEDDNGYYKFVIITEGNPGIRVDTSFAIIDSVASATYDEDGTIRTTITVYDAESNGELVTYFLEEDETVSYKRGTVVAMVKAGDVVTELVEVFDKFADVAALGNNISWTAADKFMGLGAATSIDSNDPDAFFVKTSAGTEIEAWTKKASSSNGWARLGFGAIVAKNGSSITFANYDTTAIAADTLTKEDGTVINKYALKEDSKRFNLEEDANIYVIDMSCSDKANSGRLSVGATASIMATPGVKDVKATKTSDGKVVSVYDFTTSVTDAGEGINYAFFKVVDNRITDIVVFIPEI